MPRAYSRVAVKREQIHPTSIITMTNNHDEHEFVSHPHEPHQQHQPHHHHYYNNHQYNQNQRHQHEHDHDDNNRNNHHPNTNYSVSHHPQSQSQSQSQSHSHYSNSNHTNFSGDDFCHPGFDDSHHSSLAPMPDPELDFDADWNVGGIEQISEEFHADINGGGQFNSSSQQQQRESHGEYHDNYNNSHNPPPPHSHSHSLSHALRHPHHPDQPQPPAVAVYDDSLDSFDTASSSTPSPSAAASHQQQPQIYHSHINSNNPTIIDHTPPHSNHYSNYPPPPPAASSQRKRIRSRSEGYSANSSDPSMPGVATINGAPRPLPVTTNSHHQNHSQQMPQQGNFGHSYSHSTQPLSIHRSQSQYSPSPAATIAVAVESPNYGSSSSSFYPPPSPSAVLSVPFSGLRVVHEQEHDHDMPEERVVMVRKVSHSNNSHPSPMQQNSHNHQNHHQQIINFHSTQPVTIASRPPPPPPHFDQVSNARMRSVRTSSAPTSAIIADPNYGHGGFYDSYSNPHSPATTAGIYHGQPHNLPTPPIVIPHHPQGINIAPSPARRRVIVKARSSSTSGTAPRLLSPHTQSSPSTPRQFYHQQNTPTIMSSSYTELPPLQLSSHSSSSNPQPPPPANFRRPHSQSVTSPRGYAIKNEFNLNVDVNGEYHSQPNTGAIHPSQSPTHNSQSASSSPNGRMQQSPKYQNFNFNAGQSHNAPPLPHPHSHTRYTPSVRQNTASAPPFIDDMNYSAISTGEEGFVQVKQEVSKPEQSPTPSTSTASSSRSQSHAGSPATIAYYQQQQQPAHSASSSSSSYNHSQQQSQWVIANPPSPHNNNSHASAHVHYAPVPHSSTVLVHSVPHHHASIIGSPVSSMSFLSSPTPSSNSQSPPMSPPQTQAIMIMAPPVIAAAVTSPHAAYAIPHGHVEYHHSLMLDDSGELIDEGFDNEPGSIIIGSSMTSTSASAIAAKKLRAKRRKSTELPESERWNCPLLCGKYFRRTSSRSIGEHMKACPRLSHFRDNPAALLKLTQSGSLDQPLWPSATKSEVDAKLEAEEFEDEEFEGEENNEDAQKIPPVNEENLNHSKAENIADNDSHNQISSSSNILMPANVQSPAIKIESQF